MNGFAKRDQAVALGKHNAPWVRASAICNSSNIGRLIARANNMVMGRSFATFDSRAAARLGRDAGRTAGNKDRLTSTALPSTGSARPREVHTCGMPRLEHRRPSHS